jgi:phage terminase large subunit
MAIQNKRNTIYVNDAFIPFMTDEHRYCILYGGGGSGKSVSVAQKVVLRCLQETGTLDQPFKHRIAVIRKYRTSIKSSVYAQIKAICDQMGILDFVTCNDSYYNFKFYNGSEIFCLGLDDTEKIKSLVATSAWVEEATELEELDLDQLDLRFRGFSQYYKQIILSFNPVDETHWIKRKFFDNNDPSLIYIMHSTYKDNAFIDDQYKRVLEDRFKYDENQYRIYVKGEWGRIKTGSEYYFNFKPDKHVCPNVTHIKGVPLHISFDFNVNPYISAVIYQIYRRPLPGGTSFYFANAIGEVALANPYNNTDRLCEYIINKYKNELNGGVFIYGDASGKNRNTRSNVSDYDIIEHYFSKYMNNRSMNVPLANPMIKRRRNFVNKLLFGGFNIEFKISPDCKHLINDIEVAIEEPDGSKKKQMGKDPKSHVIIEKNGHHADCNDYFLCSAFERYYDSI